MYRLMIVEDDRGISEAVKHQAEQWGMEVSAVMDFRGILTETAAFKPHIILLDISLPYYDGYYWCAEIRKVSKVPIIFISSASDNMNIIMAMNLGADDFVAKPFDLSVLFAKIQALLRRTYNFSSSSDLIEHKGAILSTSDNSLVYNGEQIPLTPNEYKILLTLLENKGKTVSREKLMEKLWNTDSFVDENTLTVNVNRLRKKLDAAGLEKFIQTKFGEGYTVSE